MPIDFASLEMTFMMYYTRNNLKNPESIYVVVDFV